MKNFKDLLNANDLVLKFGFGLFIAADFLVVVMTMCDVLRSIASHTYADYFLNNPYGALGTYWWIQILFIISLVFLSSAAFEKRKSRSAGFFFRSHFLMATVLFLANFFLKIFSGSASLNSPGLSPWLDFWIAFFYFPTIGPGYWAMGSLAKQESIMRVSLATVMISATVVSFLFFVRFIVILTLL